MISACNFMKERTLLLLLLQYSILLCGSSMLSRSLSLEGSLSLNNAIPPAAWPLWVPAQCQQSVRRLHPREDVFLVDGLVSAEDCSRLVGLMSDSCRLSAVEQSEGPHISFDRTRVTTALLPLVLLSASVTTYTKNLNIEGGINIFEVLAQLGMAVLQFGAFVIAVSAVVQSIVNSRDAKKRLNLRTSTMIPLQVGNSVVCDAVEASDAIVESEASDVVRRLVLRAADLLQVHPSRFERPALTYYQFGQHFSSHHDASCDLVADGWVDLGGQRLVTLIFYLNDVPSGGRTVFDDLNVFVEPKRGQALLFFPADRETGLLNPAMKHHAASAIDDKYVVQIWTRQCKVPPPLGFTDHELAALEGYVSYL